MANMCPNNHDRDIVGVTKWRRCRECERERGRKATQRRREREQTHFRYPNPPKRVKPVTDGLEALYGPVPDLVPDAQWYDEVIVLRVLNKKEAGRVPYPLEWAEIIRRMPRAEVVDADVAEACGVSTQRVADIRKEVHGRRALVLSA